MDNIIVGLIVAAALIFSIRSLIKAYKGEGGCNCSSSCGGCSGGGSQDDCDSDQPFKVIQK